MFPDPHIILNTSFEVPMLGGISECQQNDMGK